MDDDEKTMLVNVTRGPYAGGRLTMSETEAKQAIADGWAVDPFGPPKPDHHEGEDFDDPTEEQIAKAVASAEKAARRLRGETEPKEGKAPAKAAEKQEPEPAPSAPEPAPASTTSKSKK